MRLFSWRPNDGARFARCFLLLFLFGSTVSAADFPRFEMKEIDPHVGEVCYALTTADVNSDGRIDVVAVSENAVVWYEAPSWSKHDIIRDETARDNVCIQAHDVDRDGKVDFVLGAAWKPTDTKSGGTLQWLKREGKGWKVIPIAEEPTLHRIRFGDVLGKGEKQLVAAPLQGRGTKGPKWNEGEGSRILVFKIPDHPETDPWPMEVADSSLHTVHNLQIADFEDRDKPEILLACWEGVFVLRRHLNAGWAKTQIGSGNQTAEPFKGASEVKLGRLANGRKYVATIEPWHGFQVVVYTPPQSDAGLWDRHVVDEPLQWGHAVWCANIDDDQDQELIIGQRDKNQDPKRDPSGPGLFVYDPITEGECSSSPKLSFKRHVIDNGGVAVEDALAADLNGDGKLDLLAGGRATHNVRIYINKGSH